MLAGKRQSDSGGSQKTRESCPRCSCCRTAQRRAASHAKNMDLTRTQARCAIMRSAPEKFKRPAGKRFAELQTDGHGQQDARDHLQRHSLIRLLRIGVRCRGTRHDKSVDSTRSLMPSTKVPGPQSLMGEENKIHASVGF